jgi:regulator of replication initiation timing
MKVRFKTSIAGMNFAYRRGQIVDAKARLARAWIKSGVAEEIAEAEARADDLRAVRAENKHLRAENEALKARVAELEIAAGKPTEEQ